MKVNSIYGPLFSIEHKDEYIKRYDLMQIPISALCFNSRFAWSVDRFYQFKIIEDCVCLYCEGEEGLTSQHIVLPIGELNKSKIEKIIEFYNPAFEENNNPVKVMFVPNELVEMFEGIDGFKITINNLQDFDEYVYETQALKQLKGKTLKSKKNQLNRFFRDCTGCEQTQLKKDDMQACLKLTEDWCKQRGIEIDDLKESDYIPIKICFENFDKLDIRGTAIWLHSKLLAFSIGSLPIKDTGFIHFEKVDQVITGANVAIVVATLEGPYADVKYINREEDMGIEGLRTAKSSFNPIYMTQKNDVYIEVE